MSGYENDEPTPGNPDRTPAATGTPPPTSRPRRWLAAVGVACSLVAAGVAGGATDHLLTDHDVPGQAAARAAGPETLTAVVAAIVPTVVSLQAGAGDNASQGSGVVIGWDGLILTNNHIVAAREGQIVVVFADGHTTTATVAAADAAKDLALLRIPMEFGVSCARLGDSATLRTGDRVIAVGNPLGLPGTVSVGVVSALHRTVTVNRSRQSEASNGAVPAIITYRNAIQTDAEINQGNSGGPLFNSAGQVIGITSVMGSDGSSTGSIGIGFAIPVNDAKEFIARATASR